MKTDMVLVAARNQCIQRGIQWTPELLEVFRAIVDPIVRQAENAEQEAMAARRSLDALKAAEKARCSECGGKGSVPDDRPGKSIRICDSCAGAGER